jgi:glyoxylase-like metal-dependent hydrolase (beta-lactamase superfamily II)
MYCPGDDRHKTTGRKQMADGVADVQNFRKWRIGEVTVTRVLEMDTLTLDPAWLLQTTADVVKQHTWLQPDFATADGQIIANIQAFIIESGGKRIMVDPCIGNQKPREAALFNMLDNPFLERLEAAGFPPESIDVVLCTHLHVDHCGWNTRLVDGKWIPTFPNARYLFARAEFEYAKVDKGHEQEATYNDSVKPIMEAGLAELVELDHQITQEVRLEPSPGHTPGHCCIVITSAGEEAVITGDLMHHPVQAAEPQVCSTFDFDEEQARATRRAVLCRCTERGSLMLGTHFAGPTGVRVRAHGKVWRVEGA